MLISPTEPAVLRQLGMVSVLPEQFGVDFLIPCHDTFFGVQRKELSDLLASVHDGRLGKELGQMQRLSGKCLVVEGKPQWSLDGGLMNTRHQSQSQWTRDQHRNLLMSVQSKGCFIQHTDDLADTSSFLTSLIRWLSKPEHNSLTRSRSQVVSAWGTATNRDFQLHVLQGLPGVGPELAERILVTIGRMPFAWRVSKEDLQTIPGIGPKKAGALWRALEG